MKHHFEAPIPLDRESPSSSLPLGRCRYLCHLQEFQQKLPVIEVKGEAALSRPKLEPLVQRLCPLVVAPRGQILRVWQACLQPLQVCFEGEQQLNLLQWPCNGWLVPHHLHCQHSVLQWECSCVQDICKMFGGVSELNAF